MKTAKEALANHLYMDMADMKDYIYQPGRYTRAVYALHDGYYCAVKDEKKLPQPTRHETSKLKWVQQSDSWCEKYGWKIFKAEEIDEL